MVTRPLQTSGHMAKKERAHGSQGHYFGWGPGDAAISADARNIETAVADLRQAADLLFADHADAGRHSRSSDYHDAGRERALTAPARRRQAMGNRAVLCDPGPPRRDRGGIPD